MLPLFTYVLSCYKTKTKDQENLRTADISGYIAGKFLLAALHTVKRIPQRLLRRHRGHGFESGCFWTQDSNPRPQHSSNFFNQKLLFID